MIPDNYYSILASIESSNEPYAKASTSSASGLYQLIRSTWIALGGEWGNDLTKPFGGLMPSVEEQTKRVGILTEQNAEILTKWNVPITCQTLYAAHFLGPANAHIILSEDDATLVSTCVDPHVIGANPFLEGMTVSDFNVWLAEKTDR